MQLMRCLFINSNTSIKPCTLAQGMQGSQYYGFTGMIVRLKWCHWSPKDYKPFIKFKTDLARRPPLELGTHVMKSSRKECSLLCRCRGRFPSSASRMVGEWDRASPFPRIPECALHTWENQKSQTITSFYISRGRPNELHMLLMKYLKWGLLKNLQILLQFISLEIWENVLHLIRIIGRISKIKEICLSAVHILKTLDVLFLQPAQPTAKQYNTLNIYLCFNVHNIYFTCWVFSIFFNFILLLSCFISWGLYLSIPIFQLLPFNIKARK